MRRSNKSNPSLFLFRLDKLRDLDGSSASAAQPVTYSEPAGDLYVPAAVQVVLCDDILLYD